VGIEERRRVFCENVEREKATVGEQEQVRNIIIQVCYYIKV
jgi:hypothetical protein